MLFHVSIDAQDPRHIAEVIAELWGGTVTRFPSVIDGSYVALACDDRNTMVEVYPRGTEFHEAEGGADAFGLVGGNGDRSSTHFAMASPLSQDQVLAIAAREGWPAKYCKRGNMFGVIEMWMEGTQMVEVLTPEMQAEYLGNFTVPGWKAMLDARGMGLEAA
jgi:hypothetical protein